MLNRGVDVSPRIMQVGAPGASLAFNHPLGATVPVTADPEGVRRMLSPANTGGLSAVTAASYRLV